MSDEERIVESIAVSKFATNSHQNLVQILRCSNITPFMYFLDLEICDGNLRELVLDTDLPPRYHTPSVELINF